MRTMEQPAPTPVPELPGKVHLPHRVVNQTLWQLLRFGLVGCLNTLIDLLALNCLLWLWPAQNTVTLILYNSLAYALGALNSFMLNRYWTFQHNGRPQMREVAHFILTTLAAIACNDLILGVLSSLLQAMQPGLTLWANVAKLGAIGGTMLISYLGMRLWVFAHRPYAAPASQASSFQAEQLSASSLQREINTSMIETENRAASPGEVPANQKEGLLPHLWQKLALGAIMLTAIFMNFYQLGQNGFGNLFYAAGVRSMADSLHDFFFVSYDPGGFVTIDKPPVGFWLQASSVRLFGFTPFSIFLPQALAGVLAVLVLFLLVRRHMGVIAGLLAALALALSPLSVVTNRNNTIDSTLALVLLLGAWAIMRAAETGKWRWLLLSAALVGLGFNIKMMEAYLVVPAFGLLYLLAAPRGLWMRLGQLAIAIVVLLTVSLSWAIVVDLTPASQRPYVGSSQDNSEVSLAFGYNGIDRLLGRFGLGGGKSQNHTHQSPADANKNAAHVTETSREDEVSRTDNNFPNFLGSGNPGPFRLFETALGGQIAWLLPIAILGMLALAWQHRPRFQQDRQQQLLLLWGAWLLTMGIFFSVANFFHTYYMTTFAPAICALFGIGLVVMWEDYRRHNWRGWLLPLALFLTACEQIHIIIRNPAWGTWLIPLIAIPCILAALALSAARLLSHLEINARVLVPALASGVAALLFAPAVWSAIPALQNMAPSSPQAGPNQPFGGRNFARLTTSSPALISYLEANQGHAEYLVATPSSMSANAIILATNKPVMALGGFAGNDPILTQSKLALLVSNGIVRFFLLNNPIRADQSASSSVSKQGNDDAANLFSRFGFGEARQNALTTWVTQHCTAVSTRAWQSATPGIEPGGAYTTTQLYDCAAVK